MVDHTIEESDNRTVITLSGEIDLYSVGNLKKDLMKVIEESDGEPSFILDMSQLKYMDSSGIALMANLQKKVKAKNGKFFMVGVNEDIMNVLRLSALDNFFRIYDSLDAVP